LAHRAVGLAHVNSQLAELRSTLPNLIVTTVKKAKVKGRFSCARETRHDAKETCCQDFH
jgi:hypothetical protein